MKRQELLVLLDEAYEEPDKHVRSIEVQVRLTELAQLEWAPEEWELKRELRHNANWGARFIRTATWAECVALATGSRPAHERRWWGDRARALTEGRQPPELDERDVQLLRWYRTMHTAQKAAAELHARSVSWCNQFVAAFRRAEPELTEAFETVKKVYATTVPGPGKRQHR